MTITRSIFLDEGGGAADIEAARNGDGSITLIGTAATFAYKLAGASVVYVSGHGSSTYDIPASSWTDEVEGAGNLPATLPAGSAPTVPDAITDLAATHGNAQVVLTWTPPDDGGSALTGYTVERSLDGSTGWTEIATPGAAATGATDTGLTNGTEYFYRVKAINGEGAAATWSNVDSATPATVPAQVTTLAAIAGDTEIDLSWTAPNNGGSALTGYTLQRKVGAGSFANLATPAAGATSYSDTGLTNGVLYTYRIVAENAEGAAASWSNEASGTPDVSDYTFYTNEGGTSFTYDETTLTVVGGTYDGATLEVTPAELATGAAFQVVGPSDATSALPNAVVTPGLYVSLEEIEYMIRWFADDVEIVGEVDPTYTILSPDYDTSTVEYRETVSTMSGGATVYSVVVQDGFQEVALNFDGTNYFRFWNGPTTTLLGSGSAGIQSVLMFLSFDLGPELDAGDVLGSGSFRVYNNSSGSQIKLGSTTYTIGGGSGRMHLLATVKDNVMRAVRMTPGGSVVDSGAQTGANIFTETSSFFCIGATSGGGDKWRGKIYNVSVWDLRAYGGTFPDVTSAGVQDLFWNGDGVMRPPAMAQAVYGDGDGGSTQRMLIGFYGDSNLPNNGQDFINSDDGRQFGTLDPVTGSIVGSAITATIP